MATETWSKQLRDLADQCTQTPIDELLINPDWGKITFDGCRTELDRTYTMLNQFKLLPIELLPDGPIQQIVGTLPPIKQTLDQIRAFTIENGNPTGTRDQLVNQFKSQADQFYTPPLPGPAGSLEDCCGVACSILLSQWHDISSTLHAVDVVGPRL